MCLGGGGRAAGGGGRARGGATRQITGALTSIWRLPSVRREFESLKEKGETGGGRDRTKNIPLFVLKEEEAEEEEEIAKIYTLIHKSVIR